MHKKKKDEIWDVVGSRKNEISGGDFVFSGDQKRREKKKKGGKYTILKMKILSFIGLREYLNDDITHTKISLKTVLRV